MESIGERILNVRKQKGLSQEQLADLSKINLRTLQRIEKGDNDPRGNTLRQICEVLQINVEELVDYGKVDDRDYLIYLHLSVMLGVIIPLGNIVLPLIFWQNKKDKIRQVSEQGRNILNFQIFYTIVANGILFAGIFGKITHQYDGSSFLYAYYGIVALAFIYPIVVAVRIGRNKIRFFYPNLIRFVR